MRKMMPLKGTLPILVASSFEERVTFQEAPEMLETFEESKLVGYVADR